MRFRGLLIALAVDDFGSGLFVPASLLYITTVVGLPVGLAGVLLGVATALGMLVPPVVGHVVDRLGPRNVVIVAQLVQAAGAVGYLLSTGPVGVFVSAALLACGLRAFYSSVFTLIADVPATGTNDRKYTVVAAFRAVAYAAGGLTAAVVLTLGPNGFRVAIGVDAVSFLFCAAVLALFVTAATVVHEQPALTGFRRLLGDRPFLLVILATMLSMLGLDVFIVGMPEYVHLLNGPPWLPGVLLTVMTVAAPGAVVVLRIVRRFDRPTRLAVGALTRVLWAAVVALAALVPGWALVGYLLMSSALLALAAMIETGATMALVEASAPPELRGRYLAVFQYSFAVAQIGAPLLVALFVVAPWLPWAAVAVLATPVAPILLRASRRLPVSALR